MQVAPTSSPIFVGNNLHSLTQDNSPYNSPSLPPAPAPVHTSTGTPSPISNISPTVVDLEDEQILQTTQPPVVRIRHKRSISFSGNASTYWMNNNLTGVGSSNHSPDLPVPRTAQPRPTVTTVPKSWIQLGSSTKSSSQAELEGKSSYNLKASDANASNLPILEGKFKSKSKTLPRRNFSQGLPGFGSTSLSKSSALNAFKSDTVKKSSGDSSHLSSKASSMFTRLRSNSLSTSNININLNKTPRVSFLPPNTSEAEKKNTKSNDKQMKNGNSEATSRTVKSTPSSSTSAQRGSPKSTNIESHPQSPRLLSSNSKSTDTTPNRRKISTSLTVPNISVSHPKGTRELPKSPLIQKGKNKSLGALKNEKSLPTSRNSSPYLSDGESFTISKNRTSSSKSRLTPSKPLTPSQKLTSDARGTFQKSPTGQHQNLVIDSKNIKTSSPLKPRPNGSRTTKSSSNQEAESNITTSTRTPESGKKGITNDKYMQYSHLNRSRMTTKSVPNESTDMAKPNANVNTSSRENEKDTLSPQYVLKNFTFKLHSYERTEILQFPHIYYYGQNCRKKPSAGESSTNFGFDDERGDYQIASNDHLLYRYEILEILGKGSFGQVIKAEDHKTGQQVAIKIIRNKKRFHTQALVELKILECIKKWDPDDTKNLVHIFRHFYFRNHLCIVFELLSINLYEFLKSNSFQGCSVSLIRRFTVQMLRALSLLNKHHVVHCDLKPENVLLKYPNKSAIKVIDLGSSCFESERIYTYIQSRFYRSPEVILGMPYNTAIDMWSLGCIVAELYTGYPLFPGESEREQLSCIMEVLGTPPTYLIEKCSRRVAFFDTSNTPRPVINSKGKRRRPGAKNLMQVLKCTDDAFMDFISKCLEWDPEKRMTPDEGLRHYWITGTPGPPAQPVVSTSASPLPISQRRKSMIVKHTNITDNLSELSSPYQYPPLAPIVTKAISGDVTSHSEPANVNLLGASYQSSIDILRKQTQNHS
ncbi:serine/threonine protein kinase, CMGC, dual-specificity [Basidiobolus ranarum]|uniref:dual-specificity kinase n=1 Tax=Basidiobolus ranarum TaxID=34480 RepID=A0ABR2VTX0_9FUNG